MLRWVMHHILRPWTRAHVPQAILRGRSGMRKQRASSGEIALVVVEVSVVGVRSSVTLFDIA